MTLPDQAVRERAATASDCNLVVNAGAGTGKTTLLVDRFLHLLFRNNNALPLHQIVALTFTNKAAHEMKVRLRSRLIAMREMGRSGAAPTKPAEYDDDFVRTLQFHYGLSRERMAEMADRTLQEFERAQIVTIHGFAAHLLRMFPIEGRVDPSFQEDEGSRLRQHFEEHWAEWLEQELGPLGQHHDLWRGMLSQAKLREIEAFAGAFMDELVPLPESPWPGMPHGLPSSLKNWLLNLAGKGRTVRKASLKFGIIEQMLEAAVLRLDELAQSPDGSLPNSSKRLEYLDRSVPPKTTTWPQEDYDQAKTILQIAQASYGPESETLEAFLSLLLPFIAESRQRFVESGWISFSGLLARARTLLRDHPHVRREVKSHIGALLVDEFQDTDPVQYELILFLTEVSGQEARDWRTVRLEPGKLFVVGDPKQSIYAFRRADIEAYDVVIQDFVMAGHAPSEQHNLQCNFRSHADLLTPINACFTRLFPQRAIKGLQPQYEALLAAKPECPTLSHEGMEMRLVVPADRDADTDQATRDEAEALARWLKEEVIDHQEIQLNGTPVRIRPRHVAVLLRTLTQMRVYLEAFRRHDLPYLTEGEKHFFERQEVRDCLCILRVLANPHDRIAMVGVLRSPIGGCSDSQIAQLFHEQRWKFWEENGNTGTPSVFRILRELHNRVLGAPLSEVMDIIFQAMPILELAAATVDGEQAVANILKLRDMVQELAVEPELTYRGLVEHLLQWVDEEKPEAEASLSEEIAEDEGEDGAIRILSIHKAKGLEFPMVIVAGLHRATDARNDRVWVSHDWLTDLVGFRMGKACSMSGLFVESKLAERFRSEQIRLLYVALTRAQRRLVLSAGLPPSRSWRRGSLLGLLTEGLNLNLEELETHQQNRENMWVSVGGCDVRLSFIQGREPQKEQTDRNSIAWRLVEDRVPLHQAGWKSLQQQMAEHHPSPLFMSPTTIVHPESRNAATIDTPISAIPTPTNHMDSHISYGHGRLVGIVAHHILQGWDFKRDPSDLPTWVEACCRKVCVREDPALMQELLDDLQPIFAEFVRSDPYTRLCEADILCREVPFAISWPVKVPNKQVARSGVMQGVMDLVYRWREDLWVADYKTDQVTLGSIKSRAERYTGQVEIYRRALARSSGVTSVKAQLIFLRVAQTIEWS